MLSISPWSSLRKSVISDFLRLLTGSHPLSEPALPRSPTSLSKTSKEERDIWMALVGQDRTHILRWILLDTRPSCRPSMLKPIQTRDHVIQSCPTYERHHIALHEVSQTLYLPDLLGTWDGTKAMTSFLEKYRAFTRNGHSSPMQTTPHITDRLLTTL